MLPRSQLGFSNDVRSRSQPKSSGNEDGIQDISSGVYNRTGEWSLVSYSIYILNILNRSWWDAYCVRR